MAEKGAALPKWAYDKEYMTEWAREVSFLRARGIEPSYIKQTRFGVTRFKYTKCAALFAALHDFWHDVEARQAWRRAEELYESGVKAPIVPAVTNIGDVVRRLQAAPLTPERLGELFGDGFADEARAAVGAAMHVSSAREMTQAAQDAAESLQGAAGAISFVPASNEEDDTE